MIMLFIDKVNDGSEVSRFCLLKRTNLFFFFGAEFKTSLSYGVSKDVGTLLKRFDTNFWVSRGTNSDIISKLCKKVIFVTLYGKFVVYAPKNKHKMADS